MTAPDGPPEIDTSPLDFSMYHGTRGDHWPFTAYCRSQYGGWRNHLHLAWSLHYSRTLRAWTLCRIGRHQPLGGWARETVDDPWYATRNCFSCGRDL